jgi:uncharacterized protein YwbE
MMVLKKVFKTGIYNQGIVNDIYPKSENQYPISS